MLKIGLTGGIGSGKTTVSDRFKLLGVPVIDTDVIAHQLVRNNPDVLQQIKTTFGPAVINEHGLLNRKKLASIVFNNEDKKHDLETILHPKIREQVNQEISYQQLHANQSSQASHKKQPDSSCIYYCIIVIPLLLETDFHDLIDRILVVMAPEDVRIERIKLRDNRNMDDIQSIITNQVGDEQRLRAADDIINNSDDISVLNTKILQLHNKYMSISKSFR